MSMVAVTYLRPKSFWAALAAMGFELLRARVGWEFWVVWTLSEVCTLDVLAQVGQDCLACLASARTCFSHALSLMLVIMLQGLSYAFRASCQKLLKLPLRGGGTRMGTRQVAAQHSQVSIF